MDVARAVREDLGRAHADYELRTVVLGQERVGVVDRGDAVQAQPLLTQEVDEQQADLRVLQCVPHREIHAVAVVAGERDRVLVEDAHEARAAALVRALGLSVAIGSGEEEHVARLDEGAVVVVDPVVHDSLLDAVGEPARVEAILETAALLVIDAHGTMMRGDAGKVHVAAIGDSITAGSPWDDDPSIGWPAAAAEVDPRLHFTIRAVYGKRTDEIAAWLDEALAGAALLVVQGGINDIAQGRAVADAAANLRAMIRRERGARPARDRRERPAVEQRLAARGTGHPRAERADRGDGRARAPVPRDAGGRGAAGPNARGVDGRGRPSVGRGVPPPRAASVPPSVSYGCQSMTAPLRRVLVRPPQPADVARWREYGWRAAPDPAAAAAEHEALCGLLAETGAEVVLAQGDAGNPDALYAYDPLLVGSHGAVLLRPGKAGRLGEPAALVADLERAGVPVVARVEAPGTIEGATPSGSTSARSSSGAATARTRRVSSSSRQPSPTSR